MLENNPISFLEDEPADDAEELITWQEAEWTREALGMSLADFARMLGVNYSVVYYGLKRPQSFLSPQAALMLRLGVNRKQARG